MRSGLATLATLATLLSSGCVQVSDFNPVGDAASIAFAWTVDGAFPTSERCAELGASYVRVTFVDGTRPVPHPNLLRNCATCAQGAPTSCLSTRACMRGGEVECYDTEDAKVVAEGDWTVRVEALDGSGSVIQASPETVQSAATGRIVLPTASFLSGRISADLSLDGAAPTFAACEAAGIESVELVFDAAGGAVAPDPVEACTVGGVGTHVEPDASYTVRLRALGPAGSIVGESPPETFVVGRGEAVTLNGGEPIELTEL